MNSRHRWALIIVVWVLLFTMYYKISPGETWKKDLAPAGQAFLFGESPYTVDGFYSPPWILLLIAPLSLLPIKLGSAFISLISLSGYIYAAFRLGAKPLQVIVFALLPFVFWTSNIDGLVALGYILPPQFGLFLILLKPQYSSILALFWGWEAWKDGGFRKLLVIFTPVIIAFLVSFLIFGFYPAKYIRLTDVMHNFSPWPASLPIGLTLIIAAFRKKQRGLAIAAGPMFSPYSSIYSWPLAILGLLPDKGEFTGSLIGLYLIDLFIVHEGAYIISLLR